MSDKDECSIRIRLSLYAKKIFKKMKEEHNLSAREVIVYSHNNCDRCNKDSKTVTVYDKNTGEPFEIPKNILSKK